MKIWPWLPAAKVCEDTPTAIMSGRNACAEQERPRGGGFTSIVPEPSARSENTRRTFKTQGTKGRRSLRRNGVWTSLTSKGGLFAINQLSSNLSQRTEPNDISCERLNELELGLAVVMKFAVDEVNANPSLLPGIKLGYEIQDTCRQTAVIVRPAISFLTAKNSKELSVQCNYTDYETSVVAVIGPYDSEMVSAIGKVLGFFLMPQISFGASSNKFSDKRIYPSFFRTVPSDTLQIDAMVLLLEEFKWNWVAVVASDEEFGQQGAQEFTKKAESTSMCVAYKGMIPVYTDPVETVQNIVDNIQASKVKVVLVFSLPDPAGVFFKEVINRKIKGVWIASASWVFDNRLTSIPAMQSIGTVIGFTYKTKKLDLLPAYTEVLFTKLSEQKKTSYDASKVQNPCPQCWNLSPANVSLVVDPAVMRISFSVYAAIYSVAQSLHNMLGCNSSTCIWDAETRILPWKLLRVLQNTSFNINGKHLVFDSSGNPNIGFVVIQWVWTDSNLGFLVVGSFEEELRINKSRFKWHTENVPKSTCSAACEIGQIQRVKGFHSCCFDCVDCLPGTYQAKNEDIQCTPCPKGQWSESLSTNCSEPTFEVLSWNAPEALYLAIGGASLLLCQVGVAVIFLRHWRTPIVAASGGPLTFVALFSLIGACLSLALFLGQPRDAVCRLQLPLTFILQTIALSVITSISLQIFLITEFHDQATRHLQTLRGPACWMFLIICCAVQAGFCGWFVQEGPSLSEYMANMEIDFLRAFLSCPVIPLLGLALMQGLNVLMAIVSFMCTLMATKRPQCSINMSRRRIHRRALSDTSDGDVDVTELEKAKLLRQYRIMDADRQAYRILAQQQIRKQQQEIEKLTAEQKEMEHKLSAYNSLSRQKKDKTNAESLKVLQEQRERLDEELEKETQHQRELQKEISSMEIKLKGLRKGNSSTSDIQRSAHRRNQEAMCTFENKLQGGLTKFNEQLTKNSRLREDLQTLQIERVRFTRLHDRLLQECKDMRRKISEEIHLSNAAHDARVEAQSKLAMIREKAEKELFQYNTEMRELERVISHECSLKDFITAKYSEKMDQEGTESGLKEHRTKESSEESPDDLKVFFQQIQSVTGEEDPELMVSRFIQDEDRNFGLFNFVNEQNNEAELLREQISQIQEEMKHFQEKGLRQEEDHRCSMRDVGERRKEAELQREDFENRAAILSETLEEVKKGVSSLVSRVECEMEDAINDNNIMQHLSAVEQKTNQLLNIQTFLDNKEIGKECNSADLPKFLFGQDPEMLQENVDLQPAIHSGEFDVDNLLVADEEERPLSQGELRKRILEGVMQRESLGSKLATKSFRASTRILEEMPMAM
ncbi:taste receptor type 1 member 3 isoform X2 [Stigmatopora argus]